MFGLVFIALALLVPSRTPRGLSWACAHNDHNACPGGSCSCKSCWHG
jgi:hypothetical protein